MSNFPKPSAPATYQSTAPMVPLACCATATATTLRQPGQDVLAAARLLKLGKRLAAGDVNLLSETSPDPIPHAISTYSIPNA